MWRTISQHLVNMPTPSSALISDIVKTTCLVHVAIRISYFLLESPFPFRFLVEIIC